MGVGFRGLGYDDGVCCGGRQRVGGAIAARGYGSGARGTHVSRRRRRSATALVLLSVLVLTSCAGGAGSSTSPAGSQSATSPSEVASSEPSIDADGLTGRIAFMRGDPSQEAGVTYTVNPDGSDEQQLVPEGNSEFPTWSPDGTEIHVFCCGDGMVAHFVDPATGDIVRSLAPPGSRRWRSSAEVPGRPTVRRFRARDSASRTQA